jgi:hypothetical protein
MAVARRTRRQTKGAGTVDELKGLVGSLIKENQRLKRQVARLETKTVSRAATTATRGLALIARRLERALGSTATGRRRSGNSSSATGRTRRSGTTIAKAALARAREARAAKKAETS